MGFLDMNNLYILAAEAALAEQKRKLSSDFSKIYLVIEGNYALSRNIHAFSTQELAERYRQRCLDTYQNGLISNIVEIEIDKEML